jgi:hypothetical protein
LTVTTAAWENLEWSNEMPATPSQIASLIRQREKIGKHLGEIANFWTPLSQNSKRK